MKKEDVNRIYSIPFSILDDYESLHLTKQEEYDEEDIVSFSRYKNCILLMKTSKYICSYIY